MRNVPIEFFLIAQTRVNPEAVKQWLEFIGCSGEYIDGFDDILNQDTVTDPALLIALAAKRCYKSFEPSLNPNVTKVRSDWTEYLDNVLKSRHGSVCEHATYSFAIENVSRVFTGEMNRHRAGVAVSEASMRFIRYDDIPSWLPTSIQVTPEEVTLYNQVTTYNPEGLTDEEKEAFQLSKKKMQSQDVFREAYRDAERHYAALMDIWSDELAPSSAFKGKKHVTSMMRRIVPMGVATGGVWTLNIRALRHIMALRASEAAEEEILHVWSRAGKEMIEQEPMLLGDFTQTAQGYWVPKYDKV
jgi:thymidylate synthase (FAD)